MADSIASPAATDAFIIVSSIIGILFAAASDGPVRRAGAVRSHVFVRRRFCCAFAMVLERLWWAHSNNWWLTKEKED